MSSARHAIASPARALLTRLLDLALPPICLSCGVHVDRHRMLCPGCWSQVDFITPPLCDRLGVPLPFDSGERAVSAAALAAPPVYDRARAAAAYDGVMRDLVHSLKYRDRPEGCRLFAQWMCLAGADVLEEADVLVPVPLHWSKLWARRFNQSALIAREISKSTGLPLLPHVLRRSKRTSSQVGLSLDQRRRNVRGAFIVPDQLSGKVAGRHVLLIDDVITTGATADACARSLRAAGAHAVDVLALARVTDPMRPTV